MDKEEQQQWMQQWRNAASALAEQKKKELTSLDPLDALKIIEDLLSLASSSFQSPQRKNWSGLVEQQRIFLKNRNE